MKETTFLTLLQQREILYKRRQNVVNKLEYSIEQADLSAASASLRDIECELNELYSTKLFYKGDET